MKYILGLALIALVGCGTTATQEEPSKLGFIMVSQGKASGLSGLFGANANYCKATQYNMQGVAFTGEILYEGDTCRVEVTASDR